MRGVIEVCAIKAPGFGSRRKDLLQDIAIATGATYVAEEVRRGGHLPYPLIPPIPLSISQPNV